MEADQTPPSELTVDDPNRKDTDAAKRISSAVEKAGGATAVSRRSRVPVQSIRRYMAGREMRRSALEALADACDVPVLWLATGRGPNENEPRAATMTLIPQGDTQGDAFTVPLTNYVPIKRYDVQASAGQGALVIEELSGGYLAFEEKFLRQTLGRRRQDLVAVEAAGDSMEPAIHDGDLLVVDVTVQEIQSSRVYVLSVNGELLVKRLSLRLDGSVTVRSDNAKYPEETVTPSERNGLRIVGQVVYQAGPVRS